LAEQGATVAVHSRSLERAGVIARTLEHQAFAVQGSVENATDMEMLMQQVAAKGDLTIVVNASGVNHDGLLARVSAEKIQDVISVNLLGSLYISKYAARTMLRQSRQAKPATNGSIPPRRNIIQIGSVVGTYGNVGQAAYAASKAGQLGLVKSLALELDTKNISVNLVCPGFVQGPDGMASQLKQLPEDLSLVTTPEKVVEVVLGLLDAGKAAISGQSLDVPPAAAAACSEN
jgi:3-oxoacyl-[acyl-carrier protein] reductase